MPAHVGRLAASSTGRSSRLAIFLILASVAVVTVETASLKKETSEEVSVSTEQSTPTSASPLPGAPPSTVPAPPHPPSPRSTHPASHFPDVGHKNLRRKSSGKKKSPNHALISRFGLSRWKEEEARRGTAVAEAWRDGEVSPRIPVKEKKGGSSKRRSSEEGESAMYYVRLPPSHHYYTPFLHGSAGAEDSNQPLEPTSRDHHGHRLGVVGEEDEEDHVVRIETLPPPHHHDHHSAASHHRHHAVRRLPLSFLSNGKPGPVYHWNLPYIRGEENGKRGWKKVHNDAHPSESVAAVPASPTASSPIHPSTTATPKEPHIESDVFHVVKTVRGRVHPMAVPPVRSRVDGSRRPYHRKPLSSQPSTSFPVSSYYSRKGDRNESHATRLKAQHTVMQKSFQGNGKPHGFYVINGSKKYYHRLLP